MPNNPRDIAIADYDYPLPEERIAKFPLERRDQSKLLACRSGAIEEHRFGELPGLLPEGSMLVFNNTKVIHARLLFRKPTGSAIEIFCLEPWRQPVTTAFEERSRSRWLCFIGNNKKWKEGSLTLEFGGRHTLTARRVGAQGNAWLVDFEWDGGQPLAEVMELAGEIPLPPYLHREAEESDKERYQTVYARNEGSVAAPTAGLHFTDHLLDELHTKGFQTEYITLHVGAGTFKPVSSETLGGHEMHVEKVQMSRENIRRIAGQLGRPVIAVGTTTVRTLESVYWFGVQLDRDPGLSAMHVGQWEPYNQTHRELDAGQSYGNVLRWMEQRGLDTLDGDTQLLIAPGYRYHVVDGLITNFHQPKSTLLLLVSAMVGERWKECYHYALDHGFRFLSYGDSCLFLP